MAGHRSGEIGSRSSCAAGEVNGGVAVAGSDRLVVDGHVEDADGFGRSGWAGRSHSMIEDSGGSPLEERSVDMPPSCRGRVGMSIEEFFSICV